MLFRSRGVALNPSSTVRYSPLAVPFFPTTSTFVGTFQSTNGNQTAFYLPNSPAGGYTVGTIVWKVKTPQTDGQDILSGLFNPGVDGFADNNFNDFSDQVLFHGATVNAIPEPFTALLLGAGLAVLAAARRRRSTLISLSVALAFALVAGDSRAGATVDLLFVSRNGTAIAPTDTVTALPGDILGMNLVLSTTSQLGIHAFSLNYDLDLANELDPVGMGQWRGVALNPSSTVRYSPFAVPFFPTTSTFVGSWQSTNGESQTLFLPNSPAGGYAVGTIVWKVNTPQTDGQDILSGLFNVGVDGFQDNTLAHIDGQVLFHGATVNAVPEPSTALLLGAGLALLAPARRRRHN